MAFIRARLLRNMATTTASRSRRRARGHFSSFKLLFMKYLCTIQSCQPLEDYNTSPDPETIDELARACYSCAFHSLYPYIRSRAGSRQRADDVFQQSWENFIRRLHQGAPMPDVQEYLFKVADSILNNEE